MQDKEQIIEPMVQLALQHRFRLELGSEPGKPISQEKRQAFLQSAFSEIAKGMGIERLCETPVERLDQFAVMSVIKNHDTAGGVVHTS
ncbi:hypothetical protein [Diaphorobacter sp. J5-51]|uniref:hypothetical protein n=1 Tax=Diaphorobacter sp. J5-51 TaxID=680496 RepID=UPI000699F09D|nr:hypothetical protein [Diaphorobacter sp. J5-51]